MSKLTKFLRKGKKEVTRVYKDVGKEIKRTGKHIEEGIAKSIPHQSQADRRAANELVKQQIEYYKDAKEELANETANIQKEIKEQKDKAAQKTNKNFRRAFRAPGFLEDNSDYSKKLGG